MQQVFQQFAEKQIALEINSTEQVIRDYQAEYSAAFSREQRNSVIRKYGKTIVELSWSSALVRAARIRKDVMHACELYEARVFSITGRLTDVSHLVVSAAGDLNGYAVGEKGTASVLTVYAGGYNIQRFHTRVLIRSSL